MATKKASSKQGAGGASRAGRKAVGIDTDAKRRNLARLRRIEGQIRGLQSMVEDDRYCADIIQQIAAVHAALRGVGRELLRNHLKHCVAHASRQTGPDAESVYDEVVDLMYRNAR